MNKSLHSVYYMYVFLSRFFAVDEEATDDEKTMSSAKGKIHLAQSLFPSTMCSVFVEVIALLDDQAVSLDGTAVYEVAYQAGTTCLFRSLGFAAIYEQQFPAV